MDRDEPHEWLVGFLHCPAVVQITLSSVKLYLSVNEVVSVVFGIRNYFNFLNMFNTSRKCFYLGGGGIISSAI
jgi:hypothetical protein